MTNKGFSSQPGPRAVSPGVAENAREDMAAERLRASTPAQDATALADLIDRLQNWNHGHKTMIVSEVIDVLSALRATSQTPDAVREALKHFGRHDDDCAVKHRPFKCSCGFHAALSTPYASAGPQAEAVAWRWRYCRDEEIGRWIYNDDKPDLDCTKAMVELEALALAHPQPQQADGRGAVIGWQDIETAPHETRVLLGWIYDGAWFCETGMASHGWRRNGISNMSRHGQATHWQPLPDGPAK